MSHIVKRSVPEIQSVQFSRKLWTNMQAEDWLASHHMGSIKLTSTKTKLNYVVRPLQLYKRTRRCTPRSPKKGDEGISLLLGFR